MTDDGNALDKMIADAMARYNALSPIDKAAHDHEQRRSFVRGMCPSNRDYTEWCKVVDRLIPPLPAPPMTDDGITEAMVEATKTLIKTRLSGGEFFEENDHALLSEALLIIERLQAALAAQKGEGGREGLVERAVVLANLDDLEEMVANTDDKWLRRMTLDRIKDFKEWFRSTLSCPRAPSPATWNEAVEACAKVVEEHTNIRDNRNPLAKKIRALTRPDPAPEDHNV